MHVGAVTLQKLHVTLQKLHRYMHAGMLKSSKQTAVTVGIQIS